MQLNPDAPIKEYTGVWIPHYVMEDEQLSPMEKLLYGEIAGFRECYASNAWLANRIGRSERTIKRLISHLIERGYVENCGFNGRFRLIRVCTQAQKCPVRRVKNDTPDVSKMTPIDKSINSNNKLLLDEGSSTKDKKQSYGNADINELFDYWQSKVGVKPASSQQNRNACSTLIKQRGKDGAKKIVDAIALASSGKYKYAPVVSTFYELYGAYGKLSKLELWTKRIAQENAVHEQIAHKYGGFQPAQDEQTDTERAEVSKQIQEARKRLFGA